MLVMTAARTFRRRLVARIGPGAVDAGLEDDYHHFVVRVEHDGHQVTGISGEARRFPWSLCPGAAGQLTALVGATLDRAAFRSPDIVDRFQQCTHQLELGLLAIAQAARNHSRCYDIAITDPDEDGLRVVTIIRDGTMVETWQLRREIVLVPDEIAGLSVRALKPWTRQLDEDRYEAVAILRRSLQVASNRPVKPQPTPPARVLGLRNACYAYQDVRIDEGMPDAGHYRDFTDRPDTLLASFD